MLHVRGGAGAEADEYLDGEEAEDAEEHRFQRREPLVAHGEGEREDEDEAVE